MGVSSDLGGTVQRHGRPFFRSFCLRRMDAVLLFRGYRCNR